MPLQEHILIISAGEDLLSAYPADLRTLPTINRVYIFAESTYYEISPDPNVEKTRLRVRQAVERVKEISVHIAIPCSRELIFPPVYPSVGDALIRIHREFPGARFSFDLSGGSKPLCLALFSFSVWVGGDVYSSFDQRIAKPVPLPGRPVRTLLENPNYQTILAILMRAGPGNQETGLPGWVSRQYIFSQLWPVYVPSRTKKAKPGNPPAPQVIYKRGRKPAAELTHGTFSDFMRALMDSDLVENGISQKESHEKIFRITECGEIAFRLYSDPATSTLVRTILEKKENRINNVPGSRVR
jgi:hypothetical protein